MTRLNGVVLQAVSLFALLLITSCRTDEEYIIPSQEEQVDTVQVSPEDTATIKGFYLLNEGNMGSNKCTLDYYDAVTGKYVRNIYAERNPYGIAVNRLSRL